MSRTRLKSFPGPSDRPAVGQSSKTLVLAPWVLLSTLFHSIGETVYAGPAQSELSRPDENVISAASEQKADEIAPPPLFMSSKINGGRFVQISSIEGWQRLGPAEVPSLGLAAWVATPEYGGRKCADGSPSRITAYIVDVGRFTPQKLMQAWYPRAIRYEALGEESQFVLISAEHEAIRTDRTRIVVAVSGNSDLITPLFGRTPGLRVVFVAESTSLKTEDLQSQLKTLLRSQSAVAAPPSSVRRNQPIVKIGKSWSPGIEKHLKAAEKERLPEALMSLAYGLFVDAKGLVPGGQMLIKQAADLGLAAARVELIRMKKIGQLSIEIAPETLASWQTELAMQGNSEMQYLDAYKKLMAHLDQPKVEHIRPLHRLGACGQPEAQRHYAKSLMESFKPKTARKGQYLVVDMMLKPAVRMTVPPLIRDTRGDWDSPQLEDLKQTALLRSACNGEEDPDPALYVKKEDFSLKKKKRAMPTQERDAEVGRQLDQIDKLANGGSKAKVKEALSVACAWLGSEADREKLIVELKAREIGLGRWNRMRSCEYITDERTQAICRERQIKKIELVHRVRMDKLKALVPESTRPQLARLETAAMAFHNALLSSAYEKASWTELSEIDELKSQLNQEFAALVSSTATGRVSDEIRDVVTSRSLLLVPESGSGSMSVTRKPATTGLLKVELDKFKLKMRELIVDVDNAALDDLSPRAKLGFKQAFAAWNEYLSAYSSFAQSVGATQLEPSLWLHMQALYFFEKTKDFELSRAKVQIQTASDFEKEADELNAQIQPSEPEATSSSVEELESNHSKRRPASALDENAQE